MSDQMTFPILRNRYYRGKVLTARDFEAEQDYHSLKQRLDHRLLDGAGVVCGLGVESNDDTSVLIGSGMALDYDGNEIIIDEPLLRKLKMLEGYEDIKGSDDAWLCLKYAETGAEPAKLMQSNAGGAKLYDKTAEGYQLYLTAEAPDYNELFEACGYRNVSVLYSEKGLSVVLTAPEAVRSGEEFKAELFIIKTKEISSVYVCLEGVSYIAECENDWLKLEYRQSPDNLSNVIHTSFKMTAKSMAGITGQLFHGGAELKLEYGRKHYKNFIDPDIPVILCADKDELGSVLRKNESLQSCMSGSRLPIYLAKIELINEDKETLIGSVCSLPFSQRIKTAESTESGIGREIRVSTTVKRLEYWQEPGVRADYYQNTDTLAFDFELPTPEVHDYKIAHGIVDMELPGGLRVNSRKISDEIAHGLGPGNVDIRLSIECIDANNETITFSGNSEVFKAKGFETTLPWVEAAAIIYPERGTMKIGIWLHDTVPGNRIRIHYYAQKPEYDTDRLFAGKRPEIRIIPEIMRAARGERLTLKAVVTGTEDTSVIWTVKDPDGGAIDKNGIYEAPGLPGTYEVSVASGADENVKASAFVIVE